MPSGGRMSRERRVAGPMRVASQAVESGPMVPTAVRSGGIRAAAEPRGCSTSERRASANGLLLARSSTRPRSR
eukprot:scaffold10269_cov102-Isochrysis_galbana.AAC.8